MSDMIRIYLWATTALLICPLTDTLAQGRFPDPVPRSPLALGIETFATLPDSRNRQPARVSLLTTDPAGRLFANDQRGPLYSIDDTGGNVQEYLDLRDFPELRLTSAQNEQGFQGFAFHPDFHELSAEGFGKFYTIHSSIDRRGTPDFNPGGNNSFHTLLLEWQADDPQGDQFTPANNEQPYREILRFQQPFPNHNAGIISFNYTASATDPDYGNLYVALGDGGSRDDPQDNGEDPGNPYGALLRIDPLGDSAANGAYGIVSDNVLAADGDDQTLGEIYAYGLRNPQRFGWDSATGDLYIADIGQDQIEEINLGINGANYGWDHREGSFRFESNRTEGLTDPVAEYDHTALVDDLPPVTGGRAITAGDVARESDIPGLDGHLLLGDFPTGLLFVLDVDNDPLAGGQDGLRELRPQSSGGDLRLIELINQARRERSLSSVNRADLRFGISTPGDVYITNKHDGIIRRLVPLLVGDCNGDGQETAADLSCVTTLDERDAVLAAIGTLPGDLDGNRQVDFADFLTLSTNFGTPATQYNQGNIDLADGVSFADFLLLAGNFDRPTGAAVVPETNGLWPVALSFLIVLRRRR